MKAQSFEHQLRHAEPPAPDAEAQMRARRAALMEFARVHAEKQAKPAATPGAQRSHKKESLWPLSWTLKNGWLGGMATACVLVIGVSVVYLMPPKDREIQLNRALPPAAPAPATTEPPSAATTEGPAAARAEVPAAAPTLPAAAPTEVPAAAPTPPAAEPTEVPAAAPTRPAAEPTEVPAAAPTLPTSPRANTDRAKARPAQTTAVAPAVATSSATATDPGATPVRPPETPTPPVATLVQPAEVATPSATTPTPERTTDLPFPRAVNVPPAQAVGPVPPTAQDTRKNGAQTEEVVVSGSRIQPGAVQNSPSAVVAVDDSNRLNEVVITGTKRSSRLRDFFSRRQQASAPAAPTQPAAAPKEARDKFTHFETNPVKRVADDPVSTFSVDVDTAAYSFVRRKLNEGVLPQMDSVRVEEMINYFDYAWPTSESRDQPFKPTVTVSDSPWGEGKKLIHIGIKGYALPARQQPDVNLVLLIDVSGSMSSPDKLPLAVNSMELLLDSLKPTDTVAIVVYAGAAGQVLAPTPVSDKETIVRALSSLRSGGSTAGAEGIRLAYALAEKSFRKGGVNRILLATDGDFNVGITDHNELKGFVEREREKGVYLSVLGFGEGNYRDEMAQTLAQNGNGVAAYIDTLSEARKVLVQEATSSLFPIAKDVKLQVEFNPATVAEYRLVGYETRALNREDFNNDKVDAGDVGSGHTVTAIYEITPIGSNAKLIDESRYATRAGKSAPRGKANEYGFLKIRYKLPNGFRSRLLEQPILMDAGVPAALRQDVEFSTAVAGFGQLLRGSKYTGPLTFEDVGKQAQASVGEDPYGYRSEFVQLVNKAQGAR